MHYQNLPAKGFLYGHEEPTLVPQNAHKTGHSQVCP